METTSLTPVHATAPGLVARGTAVEVDDPMMQYTLKLMAHRISCGLGAIPLKQAGSRGSTAARATAAQREATRGAAGATGDIEAAEAETEEAFFGASNADPSLIMSMERTLFSAFNQALLLTIAGLGFMSIGDIDEPTTFGCFFIICGTMYAILSYALHVWRTCRVLLNPQRHAAQSVLRTRMWS